MYTRISYAKQQACRGTITGTYQGMPRCAYSIWWKYTLAEIHQAVRDDDKLMSLDKDRLERLKNELRERRAAAKSGTRPSNASAAKDMASFVNNQVYEVCFHFPASTGG